MKRETFFEKFELFADAPDAVAKMRELVLRLAVQGKLVDQIPNDEPATKLLGQIQKSKERLIKERAIRRQETDPICDDNAPFTIPQSWQWTRLGEIGDWGSGSTPPRGNYDLYDGGITWLKSGELNDNLALAGSSETVTELALKLGSFRRNQPGDVLFAMYGATIGKVAILTEPAVTNQAVCGCSPFEGVSNRYLFNYLISQRAAFHEASEGGAQPNLSKIKIVAFPFPLPPLAEQKRIVAKVDELMALCDRLEAQQQERETRHAALARASLARFADAPTPANLPFLFHPSYAIPPADLRKSILTLAVQGKLVPQDPNDEPVENRSRKTERKNGKWAGPIEEQEQPFQLPPSWTWLRLGDISDLKHGYAFSSDFFTSEPMPFVLTTPGNFHEKGGFRDRESKRKYYSGPVDPEFIFKPGDLIIPMTEQAAGLLGSPAFIPDNGMVYIHNQRLGKINFSESIVPEFAFWFFNCTFFRGELARTCTGMKVRHTSPDRILRVPFPVCPLAEQRRIVAKVDHLMALVDELETQLAASQSTAANLLDALVAELTGTARGSAGRVEHQLDQSDAAGTNDDTPDVIVFTASPSSPGRAGARPPREDAPSSTAIDAFLALLRERGSLSNSEAQAATGLDAATSRAHLQALVTAGRARTEGQRRGVRYVAVGRREGSA